MQFVFHASAHAVKGANKAQDPRGVNGHGEGSTDESGRCGTTLSFVLFFWSFTTPLSFRTATGSCSHCTNSSLSFKSTVRFHQKGRHPVVLVWCQTLLHRTYVHKTAFLSGCRCLTDHAIIQRLGICGLCIWKPTTYVVCFLIE